MLKIIMRLEGPSMRMLLDALARNGYTCKVFKVIKVGAEEGVLALERAILVSNGEALRLLVVGRDRGDVDESYLAMVRSNWCLEEDASEGITLPWPLKRERVYGPILEGQVLNGVISVVRVDDEHANMARVILRELARDSEQYRGWPPLAVERLEAAKSVIRYRCFFKVSAALKARTVAPRGFFGRGSLRRIVSFRCEVPKSPVCIYRLIKNLWKQALTQSSFAGEAEAPQPAAVMVNSHEWIPFYPRRNNHTLVVGSTGSGKTWATASVSVQLSRHGWEVLILDRTGEYCALENLGFRRYVYGIDLGVNILRLREAVDILSEVPEYMYGEAGRLTPIQYSLLSEAALSSSNLAELRNRLEELSLVGDKDDASAALAVLRRLRTILEFRGLHEDFGELDGPAVVDLSRLPGEAVKNVATWTLLYAIYYHGKRGAPRADRLVVIDEAHHSLYSSPLNTLHIVEEIIREGRRYGVHLLLSTQAVPETFTVPGTVGNILVFRLSMYRDALWAARNLSGGDKGLEETLDLITRLPTGWCIGRLGGGAPRLMRWEIPRDIAEALENHVLEAGDAVAATGGISSLSPVTRQRIIALNIVEQLHRSGVSERYPWATDLTVLASLYRVWRTGKPVKGYDRLKKLGLVKTDNRAGKVLLTALGQRAMKEILELTGGEKLLEEYVKLELDN